MYRKRNGSLGFSFTRFANAAVPNLFADPPIPGMSHVAQQRRDMLYVHQIASPNPFNLDDHSFFVGGITENESTSKKVFKALQKHSILSSDGAIDTTKIGPSFLHQVPILNHVRQKELINMLFWWEEECQRLRKLKDEEKDLKRMIGETEKVLAENPPDETDNRELLDRLKFARERIRMKIRQRPSQRRPDIEADTDNIAEAFHGRAMSAPTISIEAGKTNIQERPPEYYA